MYVCVCVHIYAVSMHLSIHNVENKNENTGGYGTWMTRTDDKTWYKRMHVDMTGADINAGMLMCAYYWGIGTVDTKISGPRRKRYCSISKFRYKNIKLLVLQTEFRYCPRINTLLRLQREPLEHTYTHTHTHTHTHTLSSLEIHSNTQTLWSACVQHVCLHAMYVGGYEW